MYLASPPKAQRRWSATMGDHQGRPLVAAAAVFGAFSMVMLLLERAMRRAGGPGIIGLELAGSAPRAEKILNRWGPAGRRAARWSLWLDFGYMLSYGLLTTLLVEHARRRHQHPPTLQLAVIAAVTADAVEGVSLLRVLKHQDISTNAPRARAAARIKFALVAVALLYTALGHILDPAPRRSRQ